eukprot:gnl/MRDRNA2_/MRDRNA2_199489_c0_seq1.p1 gnl/MRDRNA2_/MRDRNA2_199489_c0~~gnl/MRDRNA2_/MRDRNA2_199489_c0_seq1.p1  ORF type:complete len:504 (+),score=83.90 gnl/MRDRNA2_/MRDRNA2_199489_c0_seq1:126-1514(+)
MFPSIDFKASMEIKITTYSIEFLLFYVHFQLLQQSNPTDFDIITAVCVVPICFDFISKVRMAIEQHGQRLIMETGATMALRIGATLYHRHHRTYISQIVITVMALLFMSWVLVLYMQMTLKQTLSQLETANNNLSEAYAKLERSCQNAEAILLASAFDAILWLDVDSASVLDCNQSAKKVFGVDMKGTSLGDYCEDNHQEEIQAFVRDAAEKRNRRVIQGASTPFDQPVLKRLATFHDEAGASFDCELRAVISSKEYGNTGVLVGIRVCGEKRANAASVVEASINAAADPEGLGNIIGDCVAEAFIYPDTMIGSCSQGWTEIFHGNTAGTYFDECILPMDRYLLQTRLDAAQFDPHQLASLPRLRLRFARESDHTMFEAAILVQFPGDMGTAGLLRISLDGPVGELGSTAVFCQHEMSRMQKMLNKDPKRKGSAASSSSQGSRKSRSSKSSSRSDILAPVNE